MPSPRWPAGCVFRRLDDPLCVLDGVHLRRDDPGCADVECALDVQVIACGQPDDAGGGAGGLHQGLHLGCVER